jgi:hypothetical protein
LGQLKIKSQYEELSNKLREGLGPAVYPWPNALGYTYYLPEAVESGRQANRAYVSLFSPEDKSGAIQVLLQPRAVEAVGKQFATQLAEAIGAKFVVKNNNFGEFWIDGHQDTSQYSESLKKLGEAIATGWKKKAEATPKAPL